MSKAEVLHGDCLDVMRTMDAESVDAIVADPPYGTTACKWDSIIPLEPMWAELKRIIKPRGAIVMTASQPFTSVLVMSNREWFRHEWIWHKSNGGGFLNANRGPLKRHESILVFGDGMVPYSPQKHVGKPYRCRRAAAGGTTRDQSVAGWVTESNGERFPTSVLYQANDTGSHPTQKPVALMEYLIRTYTNEGETVLDFCCGSGTTLVAAYRCGRHAIGIEREAEYVEITRQRIAAAQAETPLFAEGNP